MTVEPLCPPLYSLAAEEWRFPSVAHRWQVLLRTGAPSISAVTSCTQNKKRTWNGPKWWAAPNGFTIIDNQSRYHSLSFTRCIAAGKYTCCPHWRIFDQTSRESRGRDFPARCRKARAPVRQLDQYGGFQKWGCPKMDGFWRKIILHLGWLGVPLF